MKVTKKMNYITNDKDFFNGLKDLATDIANKHGLDTDAILDKSDKISYIFMTKGLLEYEKDTRLSRIVCKNKHTIEIVQALQIIYNHIKIK